MTIDLSMHGTQSDLAYLVGVTQPAISQMMSAGKIPSDGTLGELLRAYVHHLRQQADLRQGNGQLDLVQERAALAKAQREGYEIRSAAQDRKYAPKPLLEDVLRLCSETMANNFDELERTLPARLPAMPEAAFGVVLQVIKSARAEWVRATSELRTVQAEAEIDDVDDVEVVE